MLDTRTQGSRFWGMTPSQASHWLILGFALVHLLMAAVIPLAPYETHYALYGMYPSWSYLDHPPLTGWLQALPQLFSQSDLALRIVPITLVTASQYLLASLCPRLFPKSSPWLVPVSLLIINGAIISHLSMAMAPEIPLLFASLLCLSFTLAVLERGNLADWAGLGLALGLAGLSKYTGATLALSVALVLLLSQGLEVLRRPGLWLAIVVAAVVISPILFWNWMHQWASFKFQLGYQLDDSAGTAWSLANALMALAQQLGAFSPLLFIGGIAASLSGWRQNNRNARILILFAWPILLLFFWMSGAGRSSTHWTLIAWYLLAPLCAYWLLERWSSKPVRVLTKMSAGLSIILLAGILIVPIPAIKFPDEQHPLGVMLGWKEAAQRAEQLRQQIDLDEQAQAATLLVSNWHHAGPLAWYTGGGPVKDVRMRPSQYVFWYGLTNLESRGVLVLPSSPGITPEPNLAAYNCTSLDQLPIHYGPSLVRTFHFFDCRIDLPPEVIEGIKAYMNKKIAEGKAAADD